MPISRRVLLTADALLALTVAGAAVLRTPASGVAVLALSGLIGLPLAARRRWPVPVLALVATAAAVAALAGVGAEVTLWAVAFALYPVALTSPRAAARGLSAALAAILVPGLAAAATGRLPLIPATAGEESFSTAPGLVSTVSVLVLAGSWSLAWAVRTRRRHAAELARLRTARAVAEERLRIAREVHDVVGHNLSLIAMNAAVAQHLGTEQDAALRTIEQVSRGALEDIRAVLGGLRDEPSADAGQDGTPALAGIGGLIEATRAAGVDVTVEAPHLPAVPAAVQTSAYRILQEALTNVRRHADARHCHVAVTATPGALTVRVVDDGAATLRDAAPGYGLAGMRERVALHGGTLTTGPQPTGGFAVRATLPFPT
ncbi:sensor histidine kinase [Sphaerisporangium sp. TRM90804]|uniref:sensor histidine kinase n=1 Tax=Sphaerisporangium sp. TRM90804 TaxID=3031113 RepID=UPI00244BF09A|nr:sensor histidine kinase [Sphaerisporangium sp. TRM90804]MDH2425925.1 sensor histidine kinase [Sphaerisporangium sp. TRM90804]